MLPLILSLVVSFLRFHAGECKSRSLAPALYVFGDSLVDVGNNNYIPTHHFARADYPPYGIDFKDSRPTGRVSNGKNVPDRFADYLKLHKYPPPYLRYERSLSLTGYNYASAGCGIFNTTGNLPPLVLKCLHHGKQIDLFEGTVKGELTARHGTELAQHLAHSLFFVWVGNNDYLLYYFQLPESIFKPIPSFFAQSLVDRLGNQLKRLYNLGARKLVVFEIGPLGCVPAYVQGGTTCNATKNGWVDMYNTRLATKIAKLRTDLPGVQITLGKVNGLSKDAFDNPADYGLTTVNVPCCELEVDEEHGTLVQCAKDGRVCGNRDEYLFFDSAHPSQAAYSVIAERCINDPTICSPTIQQLFGAKKSNDPIISLHSSS